MTDTPCCHRSTELHVAEAALLAALLAEHDLVDAAIDDLNVELVAAHHTATGALVAWSRASPTA